MQEPKSWLVKTGDFLFKYRNLLFPILLVALFATHTPPSEYDGNHNYEIAKDVFAVWVVLSGLVLRAAVIGFKYIKRGGLNKQVYADTLVTEGFFATCRNPLYVGNMLIYTGVLLMHGSPFVFAVGLLMFCFIYTAIIAAEEYFLRGKFGVEYDAYCAEVPRWIPKFGRLKIEGMEFNMNRVIAKDYTTMTNAVVAVVGLELWEQIETDPLSNHNVEWVVFISLLVAPIVWMALVRIIKKRGLFGAI